MLTFKVLAALLSYPTAEIQAAADEMRKAAGDEGLLAGEPAAAVAALVDDLGTADLITLQERYVDTFDRSRSLSLHLFEHVHGDSRARGQAMVDLAAMYRDGGLEPVAGELPDFLPAFLEYLSQRPLAEARETLGGVAHILAALRARLTECGSPFAAVMAALEGLAPAAAVPEAAACLCAEETCDTDARWVEPAAFGSADAPPCPFRR